MSEAKEERSGPSAGDGIDPGLPTASVSRPSAVTDPLGRTRVRDEAAGQPAAQMREVAQRGTMKGGVGTKLGLDMQRKPDLEEQDEELDVRRSVYLEMQEIEQKLARALEREAELEERNVIRAMDQEAERDLKRWLKWYREVGIHRDFARDYAKYTARMSC